MSRRNHTVCVVVGLTCGLLGGSAHAGDNEALVQVITKWDGGCCTWDPVAETGCSNLSAFDNLTKKWYDEITNSRAHSGALDRDGFYQDGNVVNSDFADSTVFSPWGDDDTHDGIDDADVSMFAGHGADANGLRWNAAMRRDESSPGAADCDLWQNEIIVGDDDLEILHLYSCESMNRESWWPEWSSSLNGAHQITGFHGLSWVSILHKGRFRNLADDGFDLSIAEAWIDNFYDTNLRGGADYGRVDQCPVVRGVGTSDRNASHRLNHEEYDNRGNFTDLGFGSSRRHIARYIKGCDPADESALPR